MSHTVFTKYTSSHIQYITLRSCNGPIMYYLFTSILKSYLFILKSTAIHCWVYIKIMHLYCILHKMFHNWSAINCGGGGGGVNLEVILDTKCGFKVHAGNCKTTNQWIYYYILWNISDNCLKFLACFSAHSLGWSKQEYTAHWIILGCSRTYAEASII